MVAYRYLGSPSLSLFGCRGSYLSGIGNENNSIISISVPSVIYFSHFHKNYDKIQRRVGYLYLEYDFYLLLPLTFNNKEYYATINWQKDFKLTTYVLKCRWKLTIHHSDTNKYQMEKIAIIITIISVWFHGFFFSCIPLKVGKDMINAQLFLDGLKWILMYWFQVILLL